MHGPTNIYKVPYSMSSPTFSARYDMAVEESRRQIYEHSRILQPELCDVGFAQCALGSQRRDGGDNGRIAIREAFTEEVTFELLLKE